MAMKPWGLMTQFRKRNNKKTQQEKNWDLLVINYSIGSDAGEPTRRHQTQHSGGQARSSKDARVGALQQAAETLQEQRKADVTRMEEMLRNEMTKAADQREKDNAAQAEIIQEVRQEVGDKRCWVTTGGEIQYQGGRCCKEGRCSWCCAHCTDPGGARTTRGRHGGW